MKAPLVFTQSPLSFPCLLQLTLTYRKLSFEQKYGKLEKAHIKSFAFYENEFMMLLL